MKVEVVPYDPAWPGLYAHEAHRLREALGEAALGVDHVGSTAVPGLAAKAVIDIHLVVANSADESAYARLLEQLGYLLIHREPDWFEHRMFRLSQPMVNLHLFSAGCPEHDRCRAFRDWLRSNDADRELYSATKLSLAARNWSSVQDYADAKTEVVTAIMARAEAGMSKEPPTRRFAPPSPHGGGRR